MRSEDSNPLVDWLTPAVCVLIPILGALPLGLWLDDLGRLALELWNLTQGLPPPH